jgi:hypothetical protein
MCFIYFYVTLARNYWLFKVYLLEFDTGRLGKIWIQQGRREPKKFEQLCSKEQYEVVSESSRTLTASVKADQGHTSAV